MTVDRTRVDKSDLFTNIAFVIYESLKEGLTCQLINGKLIVLMILSGDKVGETGHQCDILVHDSEGKVESRLPSRQQPPPQPYAV
jgi:hypothetical protein